MAVPTNKKELIAEITSAYQKLRTDFENIPESLTQVKNLEGHAKNTKMSICDLVSYLIGWGELVLKWHKIRDQGSEPDFPETGYKWNELGKLAQKFYADYKSYNYKDLLKKCDKTVWDLFKLIKSKTTKQLYAAPWYTKWTMGRMIQFNTSSPYKNAHARINKWRRQHKKAGIQDD
jgi:hypothetical protein